MPTCVAMRYTAKDTPRTPHADRPNCQTLIPTITINGSCGVGGVRLRSGGWRRAAVCLWIGSRAFCRWGRASRLPPIPVGAWSAGHRYRVLLGCATCCTLGRARGDRPAMTYRRTGPASSGFLGCSRRRQGGQPGWLVPARTAVATQQQACVLFTVLYRSKSRMLDPRDAVAPAPSPPHPRWTEHASPRRRQTAPTAAPKAPRPGANHNATAELPVHGPLTAMWSLPHVAPQFHAIHHHTRGLAETGRAAHLGHFGDQIVPQTLTYEWRLAGRRDGAAVCALRLRAVWRYT